MIRRRNAQQVFDTALIHLITQGVPAYDIQAEECQYRTKITPKNPVVLKCGVGGVITDKEYRVEMEGKNVSSLADPDFYGKILLPKALRGFRGLLADIQALHDDVMVNKDGKHLNPTESKFIKFAKDTCHNHNLSFDNVQAFIEAKKEANG